MKKALALVLAACSPAAAQYASCTFLNTLDGKPVECRAHCISADGKVVAGVLGIPIPGSDPVSVFQVFRWTDQTGIVPLGGFSEESLPQSEAFGINGDGSVLVGYGTHSEGTEAFRWTARTGIIGLGDIPGDPFISIGYGVSRDGSIVVGKGRIANFDRAFRWTADSGLTDLDPAQDGQMAARAISPDGSVIVGVFFPDPDHFDQYPFRWTQAEGIVSLGDLEGGGVFGRARGISLDNRVIVGQSESAKGQEAFRWTDETGMVGIGQLGASLAYAVSDDGNTIVGSAQMSPDGPHAFLWTPRTGMVDLKGYLIARGVKNLKNRALVNAQGISADGTIIVGTAKYLSINGKSQIGPEEAYIVHLGAAACYPDCDGTGELDIDDFLCFQTLFATNDLGADCDESGSLDIDDFICFQTAFATGCP